MATATQIPTGRVYRGRAGQSRVGGVVIEVHVPGEPVGELRHRAYHSPTGMRWGFRGAGPKDLARSLLIDALGDDVVCTVCRGGNRVVFDTDADLFVAYDQGVHGTRSAGACGSCRLGFTVTLHEESAFEADVVARLGRDWTLSDTQITHWHRGYLRRKS